MAIATVVVESGLSFLVAGLRAAGFRALIIPADVDPEMRRAILLGRVLVVQTALPFVEEAVAFDLGIVGLDRLRAVDRDAGPANQTARLLAGAVIEHLDRTRPYVALLRPDGGYVVVPLGP